MATALITGSARGIGAAIALRLAKDGYNIALNDISEAMFEDNDIMDKIKAEGVECEKFICDVSSYAQVEETVKAVKARFGTIDVLVNNAGITRDGLMARMSEEQYDMVVAVNQKSVFNMSKFVGSVMMRQKSGQDNKSCFRCRTLRQPWTDKLFRNKGGYRRHDKDSCKGAWLKRYHLQRSCPWIYQDPYDRQAHRRSEAGYDKSDSNEALRRS